MVIARKARRTLAASSGVSREVQKTRLCSVHSDPASALVAACSFWCWRSASTHRYGRRRVRRDLGVLGVAAGAD